MNQKAVVYRKVKWKVWGHLSSSGVIKIFNLIPALDGK